MERLGRLSEGELQQALEDLLKADAALKAGHPAPELLADQLIVRLAS